MSASSGNPLSSGARYSVGQLIHNIMLDYRGVVVDVDPHFQGIHGRALGGRGGGRNLVDRGPWYHILIDGSADRAYVAERNLEPDADGGPVDHPDIIDYFSELTENGYHRHSWDIN